MKIVVGISGGSGAIYALALLKVLREVGVESHLVVSRMGAYVTEQECGVSLDELRDAADVFYENDNLAAPIASGSCRMDGMVIVPCSMKTLASVASGISDSLLTRAADVAIKEGRKLILVARETPLSPIHLENMLKLARMGVTIMPASPAFYHQPQQLSDLVAFLVGRILDQLAIDHHLTARWGEQGGA